MNVVFIVPTGIGCEIGGHDGDASPSAKLIASLCDKFITHPNVFNASDINEMPENTWYVEGSILDRFLEGKIQLESVYSNKVLVVTNPPLKNEVINSVSAARATIGLDASILVLDTPLKMIGGIRDRKAYGEVDGCVELLQQISKYSFDALAVTTPIDVDRVVQLDYCKNGGVNPWGFVEAKASKLIADSLNRPVAHAPVNMLDKDVDPELYFYNEVVDPRSAAPIVSVSYLHCVLKGLHKAPRIGKGISVDDVDCLITPIGCVGRPHIACLEASIPIIAVKENKTILNDAMPESFIIVENYLEAVGVLVAMRSGVSLESVRRPLERTSCIIGEI